MVYRFAIDMQAQQVRWRKDRREWRRVFLIKNGPCIRCEENNPRKLEIHHEEYKREYKFWYMAEEVRDVELRRCTVICKVCHKAHHRRTDPMPEHGTLARYKNWRSPCRCDLCRQANASYEFKRGQLKG